MGLAQTARDRQRATIGGRANPFQNDDPLGKAFADSIEKGAGDAVKGVMDWWERSSADQEGIGDDLLRLVAGGVKNTTKAWQDATAEQEGITDDILRGVGWTAGKGMQVLDAGSYYGGQIGGKLASAVGVDARIGGAAGNIIGDVLAGGAVAKGAKIASRSTKLALMSPVQRSLSTGTVGAMKAPPTKIRQYIGIAAREAFEPELKTIQKGVDVLEEGAENILRSTSTPIAAKSIRGRLSEGVTNHLGDMNLEQGYKWISEGGELDQELSKILKVGKGKKAKSITYEELVERAKTSTGDKNKLDKYHSLIATGPAQNADDVLQYGFLDNKEARTALMKGDPNYSAQLDKSMEFHHKGMKALQAKIHMRARELRAAGKATDDDILNLHGMMNAAGTPSGSRISAGKWMHRVPHDILHKKIMLPSGVQPSQTPWTGGKVLGKPSGISTQTWKVAKKIGADTRFDLDYIENWAKTVGTEEAIKKWKAFKANKKLYKMHSPDGLNEIERMVKKMDNMSIKELTEYQQEILEDIVLPMTKEADLLEDFTLKRYTPKELHDIRVNKATTKATEEYLADKERLANIKEVMDDRRDLQMYYEQPN